MVVLACGTREPQVSDVDGVLAVDFLLQHPSVLQRFASFADPPWPSDVLPRVTETDSSEEALLGWKRSVASGVVVPMLRRLLGRGLVQRRGLTLALTPAGVGTADQLAAAMAPSQRARVELLAGEFRADPGLARKRLTSALPAESA
ncbi:MAG TPA: hypothetical protein VHZ31_08555 [Solirubrobacteraceae bacterium]|jgi:hypothetical protein|nr:hypothetical protein [Solirubrobacteraceae bacterium]